MNTNQTFFLYARKSTDVEDKQVLSIEAQLTELRGFARDQGLVVIREFIEKQSAKIPGRPIFGEMLELIESDEAGGILAWHPDRLARNSVDGGRIIYMLDCGRLQSLKFPQFWCDNTSQGKFMLNLAFGQSKYYVDAPSENTKRGLRQKVRRGEYPSLAPVGYINDVRTKSIVVDKKKSVVIRKAYEYYAGGQARLEDVASFLAKHHVLSRGGKHIHRTRATFILSNPFYTGLFRYAGELHEGRYEPIISKKLFDSAQAMLQARGKPRHKLKNDPQVFCGLISCAECGMMITAEEQVKRQQNGNVHEYTYYRCTKKGKEKCGQPFLRAEEVDRQLSSLIQKVSLRPDWADKLLVMAERDKEQATHSGAAFVRESEDKIRAITIKLQRLLDGYLEQDIEREVYRERKAKLLLEKKSLAEQMAQIEQKQHAWLEPFQAWVKVASNLDGIARDGNLLAKKVAAKEIFGSNLRLRARQIHGEPSPPYLFGLRASDSAGQIPLNQILVEMAGIEPACKMVFRNGWLQGVAYFLRCNPKGFEQI